ncbi:prepilin-type N-terminal cleavage/methylation domain-containing protein [Bhargavaea cecembensis]|uniref:prepilin-type N-terminal cleavage/methylation domain-containing protein n=1 Tax=Bhargavaea cecembensis TaxID=394098 RepID=UPI000693533A|nr:prepilin-type N-terminal cleavage/methylation domain-containing protein [Bhargavaea cecembensis]
MIKFVKNKLKEEKGLTLIELLAVIVILGIIAAIAIPAIGNIIENSRYNAVKSDALNVLNAAQIYYSDTNSKEIVTVKQLKDGGYLESQGKIGDEDTVSQTSPRKLVTKTAIDYSGSKTVTINATAEQINNDDQKGSTEGDKTIPKTGGGTGGQG